MARDGVLRTRTNPLRVKAAQYLITVNFDRKTNVIRGTPSADEFIDAIPMHV